MRQQVMPVVLCILAGSCRNEQPAAPQPAPPAQAPVAAAPAPAAAWTATSANGQQKLEQFVDASGACRATASAGWTSTTCLASKQALTFLSDDGQTLIVLEPTPRFADGAWENAELSRRYVKGTLADHVVASALIADGEKLTRYTHYFAWAKGAGGVSGEPPRLAPDGAGVLLETADGRTATLRFDGQTSVSPAPVAAAPVAAAAPAEAKPACAPSELCSYVDEVGTTQFVNGADVPPRFRAKAHPVDAQVGLMESPKADPGAKPSQAQAMNDAPAQEGSGSGITVTIRGENDPPREGAFVKNVTRQSQIALMTGQMDRVTVVPGISRPGCTPDPVDTSIVWCPKFLNQGPRATGPVPPIGTPPAQPAAAPPKPPAPKPAAAPPAPKSNTRAAGGRVH